MAFRSLDWTCLPYLLGTPALTSRGFLEEDFAKVAEYFDSAVKLAVQIKAETTGIFIFYHSVFDLAPHPIPTFHSHLHAGQTDLKALLLCSVLWSIRLKIKRLSGHDSDKFIYPIGDIKASAWSWGVCQAIPNDWFWQRNNEIWWLKNKKVTNNNDVGGKFVVTEYFSVEGNCALQVRIQLSISNTEKGYMGRIDAFKFRLKSDVCYYYLISVKPSFMVCIMKFNFLVKCRM